MVMFGETDEHPEDRHPRLQARSRSTGRGYAEARKNMGHASRVRIGTSGWVYKDWKGVVYRAALPMRRWLAHYSGLFDTVEINNSFYRMPSDVAFHHWTRQATPGFLFAIKASRYITHTTQLSEPERRAETLP